MQKASQGAGGGAAGGGGTVHSVQPLHELHPHLTSQLDGLQLKRSDAQNVSHGGREGLRSDRADANRGMAHSVHPLHPPQLHRSSHGCFFSMQKASQGAGGGAAGGGGTVHSVQPLHELHPHLTSQLDGRSGSGLPHQKAQLVPGGIGGVCGGSGEGGGWEGVGGGSTGGSGGGNGGGHGGEEGGEGIVQEVMLAPPPARVGITRSQLAVSRHQPVSQTEKNLQEGSPSHQLRQTMAAYSRR